MCNWILVYISQMIVYVIIMCKFFGFICRVGDGTIHRVNRFSGGILLCGMILIALIALVETCVAQFLVLTQKHKNQDLIA